MAILMLGESSVLDGDIPRGREVHKCGPVQTLRHGSDVRQVRIRIEALFSLIGFRLVRR